MLLFKKKDLLVVISKSDNTVQFTKPLKDILKYQHRYNYKFKMYENGKVTVADDYIIDGETLTVLFGSATVTYTSDGATYADAMEGGETQTKHRVYINARFNLSIASGVDLFSVDLFNSEANGNYEIDSNEVSLNDIKTLLHNSDDSNLNIVSLIQEPIPNNNIFFEGYNVGFGADFEYFEFQFRRLTGVTGTINATITAIAAFYI